MLAKIFTATLIGLDAKIIEVEVDIARGERKINIVGLADKAVQEAKDRILASFRNNDISLGPGVKVINLAPANIHKIGPIYDLPMAIGLLLATKKLNRFNNKDKIFIGELALDGKIRPVTGILPLVDSCKRKGFREFYVPAQNAKEASIIKGIKVFAIENIKDVINHFNQKPLNIYKFNQKDEIYNEIYEHDLSHLKGQIKAKRALEIAATGAHNLLLSGVPGSGKTYLAKIFPSILPEMTFEESIEVTRIYSIAGELKNDTPLITKRPFRSPHHTASQIALVGGGSHPRPGEISLAHRGVLFLDEFPEFDAKALEVLRQPMEDKVVRIARASGTVTFPANFQLLAAMNPCKCGYFGDPDKSCTCTEHDRNKYQRKISGPILDRIDLQVNVPKVKYEKLISTEKLESSKSVRKRVQVARNFQLERFKKSQINIYSNSEMSQKIIYQSIKLTPSSKKLIKDAVKKFSLSARSYFRILKVARTIADLEQKAQIKDEHLLEALSFRINDGG